MYNNSMAQTKVEFSFHPYHAYCQLKQKYHQRKHRTSFNRKRGSFHLSSCVDVRILLKTGDKNYVHSSKQSQLRNNLQDSIKVFAPNKSDKITLPGQPHQFTTESKIFRTACSIPVFKNCGDSSLMMGRAHITETLTAVRSDGTCRPRRNCHKLQQFIFGTTLILPGNYFPQHNSPAISG